MEWERLPSALTTGSSKNAGVEASLHEMPDQPHARWPPPIRPLTRKSRQAEALLKHPVGASPKRSEKGFGVALKEQFGSAC